MKTYRGILLIFTTLVLARCTEHAATVSAPEHARTDSIIVPMDSGAVIDSMPTNDGCAGGIPDGSIVDSTLYPNRKFHLEGRAGYDEFVTKEGDKIIIRQSNCDYASVHFTITTSRFKIAATDTDQWVHKAADIIAAINPALHASVEIDSGLLYLRKFYSEKGKPLGTEIHFDDRPADQWINVVNVESLEKNEKGCTIKVIFYEGPL